jgi:hypothetical protein
VIVSPEKNDFVGTVSYLTAMFYGAIEKGHYTTILRADSRVPVIYIDDCIEATM